MKHISMAIHNMRLTVSGIARSSDFESNRKEPSGAGNRSPGSTKAGFDSEGEMMRIEYPTVDALLNAWGRWSLRIELGGLGYGISSVYSDINWHANEDGLASCEPKGVSDGRMEMADNAVSKLKRTFRIVVIQVHKYGQGKSDRKNAAALCMDPKTLGKYLNEAHRMVFVELSENNSLQTRKNPHNYINSSIWGTTPR